MVELGCQQCVLMDGAQLQRPLRIRYSVPGEIDQSREILAKYNLQRRVPERKFLINNYVIPAIYSIHYIIWPIPMEAIFPTQSVFKISKIALVVLFPYKNGVVWQEE